MDEVARAYAILGVRPGAPLRVVRTRYRVLAKKWHPDRYVSDPQGQAEAAIQMREITRAYHHLAVGLGAGAPDVDLARAASTTGALSREQIDRIVGAMGSNSPIDWFLDGILNYFSSYWRQPVSRSRMSLSVSLGAGYLVASCLGAWREVRHPSMDLWVGVLVGLACYVVLMRVLSRDPP